MKVLVCDYAGSSAQWLEQFAIKENLEVVGTITPDTDKKLLAEKSWEYLLVFENGARQFFVTLAQFMNIPENRVVYALDWNSWATHPGGGSLSYVYLQCCATVELFYLGYYGRRTSLPCNV